MRKLVWLLTALLLLAVATAPAPAVGADRAVPNGVRAYPHENLLLQAYDQGWLHMEPDGEFHPFEPVTGTAMAAMLHKALGQAPSRNPGDRPVTRQEVAVMTVQALGRDAEGQKRDGHSLLFVDRAAIDPEMIGYVEIAVGAGLFPLNRDWFFRPDDQMTRADAAVLVWQALGVAARRLVAMSAGEWTAAPPAVGCATPDTRSLRMVVEPIPARWPEESSTVRAYLHNNTNLCEAEGKSLPLPQEGWQLHVYPYLSTYADVGDPLLKVDLPAPPAELAPGEQVAIEVQIGGGLAVGWYTVALVQGAQEGPGGAFTGVNPHAWNQAFYWQNLLVSRKRLKEWDGYARDDDAGVARAVYGENVEFQLPEGARCMPVAATAQGRNFTTLLPRMQGTNFGPVPGETETLAFEATCDGRRAIWRFEIAPIAR